MLAVNAVPVEPLVMRKGPTPTDVEMPCLDSVTRTPGTGVKLFLNRQPIVLSLMTRGHYRLFSIQRTFVALRVE
jgi:hypothetical protein